MSLKISTGLANAMVGSVGLQAALSRCYAEIRSGAQPASANAAPTGTLLGILTLDGGAFTPGTVTNGLVLDNPVAGSIAKPTSANWKFVGLQNGVAGYLRLIENAGTNSGISATEVRMDMAIGSAGAEITLSNVNIVAGVPGAVTDFSITLPTA